MVRGGSAVGGAGRVAACIPRLRRAIVSRRAAAWRWQDALNLPRTRTARRARTATSCAYLGFLKGLWAARADAHYRLWLERRNSIPVGEAELRAYINDDCLEEIIDRETAGTWSPTIYNYAGSGAYGLPQALPGWKMASAGPDWRTNPKTQIRWMRRYVNGRYGGSCGALAHHNANGWY